MTETPTHGCQTGEYGKMEENNIDQTHKEAAQAEHRPSDPLRNTVCTVLVWDFRSRLQARIAFSPQPCGLSTAHARENSGEHMA